MTTGTLRNMANLGFVRTPPHCAERILHLLQFGTGAHILDPTVGEGDLLAPCLAFPGTHLYGVELSEERLSVARSRLPDATLLAADTEAVHWTPAAFDLILANPPYFFVDGQRAEYRIIKRAGDALRPGGILVAILPARSALTAAMVHHWAVWYDQIRCWKFPDTPLEGEGDFARYTQIVVIGVRRATPHDAPPPSVRTRLQGWRYRSPKGAESPWGQGFPPPDLPDAPIADPYRVPDACDRAPTWRITRASDAIRFDALATSGAHLTPAWRTATTYAPQTAAARPVMPATGEAHLAADILTGLLDGEPLLGPDGVYHVFSSAIGSEWKEMEIDAEERAEQAQRGVIRMRVRQLQDTMLLTDLNLASGEITSYQGDAVYDFLAPWLGRLATLALSRRQPLYTLRPAEWEMRAVAGFGWDKRLPNAPHPGLALAQQHRVYAMCRALDTLGLVALQGEPGTGKTRQTLAVAKRQSLLWRQPRAIQREVGGTLPRWLKRLRRAWQANPRASRFLPDGATIPAALPVLVVTPKRVMPTWEREVQGAWPEAESMILRSYRDIDAWMQRCATSQAPMVLGILSHSLSRAFDRCWQPAVLERRWVHVQSLDGTHRHWFRWNEGQPIQAVLHAQLGPTAHLFTPAEGDADKPATPAMSDTDPATTWRITRQIVGFQCPDCGALQRAVPRSGNEPTTTAVMPRGADAPPPASAEDASPAEDLLEVVTSRAWFSSKPRSCCACGAPLWCERRMHPRHQGIPYAAWEQAVTTTRPPPAKTAKPTWFTAADGTRGPYPVATCSPAAYLRRCYRGCVALAIIDESHNARGRATDIARSIHNATLAAQTYIYASGTHYGGTLDDLFFYFFRFCPPFWRRLGFSWDDVEQAIARYGVIQQTTKEYESDARRGSGKTDVRITTLPAPGISAKLIPHLLTYLVFLSVLDVGAHMPPLTEHPVIVSMDDPHLRQVLGEAEAAERAAQADLEAARKARWNVSNQARPDAEAVRHALAAEQAADARHRDARERLDAARDYCGRRDLAGHYRRLVQHLQELAQQMNSAALLAKGTMPRWFAALPCVDPPFEVRSRQRDDWGNVAGEAVIAAAPVLEADYLYPLERALIDTVRSETQEALDPEQPEHTRTVMVYFEQNAVRDMGKRLSWVLREFDPWLLPNAIDAEDREDAIRQAIVQGGHKVVIVPYKRVAEGINLQDCVDTICWMELAQNLFHLDQASRRAWRLGRAHEVRLYYFAYAGSAAHKKLQKLGSQSGAAAAFAGEVVRGALAAHVGADKTTLARLSRSLEALEAEEWDEYADPRVIPDTASAELQAQFDRRAQELQAALQRGRTWMGLEDPLPALLAPIYAELEAAAAANAAAPPLSPTPLSASPSATPTLPQTEHQVGWHAGEAVPAPLSVNERLRWDDPDLFRKAHPRIAARRAKSQARGGSTVGAAAAGTPPFPEGSLWAAPVPPGAGEQAASALSPERGAVQQLSLFD